MCYFYQINSTEHKLLEHCLVDMPTTNDIKTDNIEENILCHPAGDLFFLK